MLDSLSRPGGRKHRKRVGRGASAGGGKTAGRGQKGQRSRSGSGRRPGFEGGQMPLQRRLPKVGFASRTAHLTARVRTSEIAALGEKKVDLALLKERGLARFDTRAAKVFLSGEITTAVKLVGIAATAGARKAIEAAGGSVEGSGSRRGKDALGPRGGKDALGPRGGKDGAAPGGGEKG